MYRDRFLGLLGVLASLAVMAGCTTGVPLSRMSPVHPLDTYEGDHADIIVDMETDPEPTLELTQKDVTVRVQYWRKAALDWKYNRQGTRSAFLSQPSWKQGDKVDVFRVTITNNRQRPLRTRLEDYGGNLYFQIEDDVKLRPDMDGNAYFALTEEANKARLLNRGRVTIDIRNGIEAMHPLLLESHLRARDWRVAPGESVEGYVPFYSIKPNATHLVMTIPMELAPESEVGRWQREEFVFPMAFDGAIYEAQPATVRH